MEQMAEEPDKGPTKRGAEPQSGSAAGWYSLVGIGFEFLASVCLFGLIGWWADRRLKTFPWLLIAGAAIGFAVGLTMMIRAARNAFKE